MLHFESLSVANARLSKPLADVATPSDFTRQLAAMQWFSRLGEVSPWDDRAVRIHDWHEWPSPEHAGSTALAEEQGQMRAAFTGDALDEQFRATHDLAHTLAQASGIGYDADQDAWHGPTQSVWNAAYTAGLIACFLTAQVAIPDDLQELWAWYVSGHSPAGYHSAPTAAPQLFIVY
jgi:hypothetical protein